MTLISGAKEEANMPADVSRAPIVTARLQPNADTKRPTNTPEKSMQAVAMLETQEAVKRLVLKWSIQATMYTPIEY